MRLAGTTEIAELLGVSRQAAHQLTRRPDFPKPIDRLRGGTIWRRTDVERWARKHRG